MNKGRLFKYNGYEVKVYKYIFDDMILLLFGGIEGFYVD